jgi:LacI family transcriptional regulator
LLIVNEQGPAPAPPIIKVAGNRRVTMTDVAAAAGCSQATVSFVLKNAPGVKISADTRARVIEAAISLGYAAPSFAHQPSGPSPAAELVPVVGFLVDQLATSPEAVIAIDAARQACWDSGQILLSAQTMNDPDLERKTLGAMLAQGVQGLIYMTIFTRKITLPPILTELDKPVVLLNCYCDDTRFPAVVPDELPAGYRATRHLIDHGHRRIGMITGEPWMEATRDRQKGYRQALTEAGIPFDPDLVVRGNWSASAGHDGAQRLLAQPHRPTAIFCQNDRMAIGCYEALKEAGLSIPGDMSVVGFDDEEISRHLNPKLTTLVLPHRGMGVWAVEQLAQGIRPHAQYPVTRLDCALISRNSVAMPAG